MRNRLPWILFAVSLVLNLCAVGGFLYVTRVAGERMAGHSPILRAAESLDLNAEQKAQFDKLRQSARKSFTEMRETIRPLRRQMLDEFDKPQPDFAKVDGLIDQINAAQASSQKTLARAVHEFQVTLTPDQQTEFKRRIRDNTLSRYLGRHERPPRPGDRPRDGAPPPPKQ